MSEKLILIPPNKEPRSKKTFLRDLLIKLRLKQETNFSVVNSKRAEKYLDLDRKDRQNYRKIPIGKHAWMPYIDRDWQHTIDRPLESYFDMLFPDLLSEKIDKPGIVKELFEDKVVLDLGSGEALPLFQIAMASPTTTCIGVDIRYGVKTPINTTVPGVQLTHDDWLSLKTIPDQSIDVVLSCQGLGAWGWPYINDFVSASDESKEKMRQAVATIDRITKPKATLRIDFFQKTHIEYFSNLLKEKGWETSTYNHNNTLIAQKT